MMMTRGGLVLLCLAVACAADQLETPSPTAPPLQLMWNTSLARYGTHFNVRVSNDGHLAIVASWDDRKQFNNITAFSTRRGALLWSQPMAPPTQAALFAVSESHIGLVGLGALLTLDVNGAVVWSTPLPFLAGIVGLAIAEAQDTSTLIVASSNGLLAFIRNGAVEGSVAGNFGPVVLISNGVVVTTSENITSGAFDVQAYRADTQQLLWSVGGGGQLTQKSVAGGEVAINMQSYVLLVDLNSGALKHNFTEFANFNVFDVSVSDSWVLTAATNENCDVASRSFRARMACPTVLYAYSKSDLSSAAWWFNAGMTQTGSSIDEATSQVALATSQSMVVLNLVTGAQLGRAFHVMDYMQFDRPAFVPPFASVLFTGGMKPGVTEFSLISMRVKS